MMNYLQRLGKSLMLPVALLPAAAILMGVGYWIDPTGWGGGNPLAAFLLKSGGAIIDNIAILFAIGVAIGMPKKKDASSALSGLAAFLIITTILSSESISMLTSTPIEEVSPAFAKINNAFIGIISGIVGAHCFERFHQVELPDALAFFSGKRLAPIMSTVFALITSLILFFVWPTVFAFLVSFGEAISKLGALGAGLFGFFNRLLIPTGLHHALNAVFFFDGFNINDIGRFWGGLDGGGVVGETGRYLAGFFPVFMFGLPGAALAMYRKALPERKNAVKSLMIAAAFASFFTGVTEPLEFSFMFVAPVLYFMHAVLTGLSLFICASFQWLAGFSFSAGLVDYILSFKVPFATNSIMLIPAGLLFFALYYFSFSWAIDKFDLMTPGRDPNELIEDDETTHTLPSNSSYADMAAIIFEGLNGSENIVAIDNCATRLRIDLKDSSNVDDAKIKSSGIAGIIKPSPTTIQIIVGPKVQFVADELEKLVK